ncbi:MAG: hypothetical protein BWY28_02693 [bacterium ADurb.Bin236]|nr:MAG: hypothetical protein BWY28_02693 [bacterium ADurb.Bin236]HOY64772.1 hypothetical protein [bacterium]HPN94805.1 hypothetical protein [bacterium]
MFKNKTLASLVAVAIIVSAAAFAARSNAEAAKTFPAQFERFTKIYPQSIWDRGKRVSFMYGKRSTIPVGLELPVVRGDEVIGIFKCSSIGTMNIHGYFGSHSKDIILKKSDAILSPLPDALPVRNPNNSIGTTLFASQTATKLWLVVDRGSGDGLDADSKAAAFLDGVYVGYYTISFLGRSISYGTLAREAIFPLHRLDDIVIDFSQRPEQ